MNWRPARIAEWACEHGVGHYAAGLGWPHSCEGCCAREDFPGRAPEQKGETMTIALSDMNIIAEGLCSVMEALKDAELQIEGDEALYKAEYAEGQKALHLLASLTTVHARKTKEA